MTVFRLNDAPKMFGDRASPDHMGQLTGMFPALTPITGCLSK